jgi:D-lactate dehydrogenase (cytochrome)
LAIELLIGDWRLIEDCRMDVSPYLEDAAHFPGGHAAGVVAAASVSDVREAVRRGETVLAVGAQSSLTGGATPMGELIVATSRMTKVLERTPSTITVEAGLTVAELQAMLARDGAWFPPAPTYTGACVGGIVATNAAGAATFKYGTTRRWVEGLHVVLADGEALALRRGDIVACDGALEIAGRRVPVPGYRLPAVDKVSAGYYANPALDAVDLFIGSEGTLGIITAATLRILPAAPLIAMALIPCRSEDQAIEVASALRQASLDTRRTGDPAGIDAAAIENMDRRCLDVIREDGAATKHDVLLPSETGALLLVQLELPAGTTAEEVYDDVGVAMEEDAPDTPVVRLCRILADFGLLEVTELAPPGNESRIADLIGIREAVPSGVNYRVGRAQATIDSRIAKTAADMIVPFERFAEMNAIYRAGFEKRGLDYAIWGHISDGNVHPNVIPRSYQDVLAGREAILEFGRDVARLGGCPLAEHGVGRNPVKQTLLRQLYGEDAIEQMRVIKTILDPDWKLAPGVIFDRGSPPH